MRLMNKEHKVLTSSQVRRRYFLCNLTAVLAGVSFALLPKEFADAVPELLQTPVSVCFYLSLCCFVMLNHSWLEELSVQGMRKMHEDLKALPDVAPIFSAAVSQGLTLRLRDLHFVKRQHEIAQERQGKLDAMNEIRQLSGE